MRVFVEGDHLFGNRTGVGQYSKNLLEGLVELDKQNSYTIFGFVFFGKDSHARPIPEGENLSYKLIRYIPSRLFHAIVRNISAPPIDLLLASKPDLFLFPNYVRYPVAFKEPTVVVIHDLSFVLHGQHTTRRSREYLNRYVPISARRSDHIITVSENSKKEIVEHYGIDPDKITIVHPALDHSFFFPRPSIETRDVARKYGIDQPYILYIGTLEPRKNINGILDAYSQLNKELQRSFTLVLAGDGGWLNQGIKRRLDELSALHIEVIGYVPDDDVPGLYSGASVFVYPSFYEGFGMPPLEAMACGVPVITANNSSIPEVVGDASILINAEDTPRLALEIERVLGDQKLARLLRAKGLARAKQFRWESSALILLDVIDTIGAKS
jgi:glycosyltransferase involved in cell wall biosynthesis